MKAWSGALFSNRHLLVVSILVLVVGGLAAFFSLPRLEDPRLTNRNPLIVTFLPGADAEQVEAQVTEPLERALREVDEIKRIETTSSLGVSFVAIELADFVADTAPVLADLRAAIDRAEPELPLRATRPWLDDQRGAAAYGVIVALRWRDGVDVDLPILSRYADELADRLRNVRGTELVRLHGEVDEQVLVEIDADELAARGLSPDRLAQALGAADSRQPVGSLRRSTDDQLLQVAGRFDTLTRIREVPVVVDGEAGRTARVGDVAEVRRGYREPPVAIGTRDGERAVFLGVRMQPTQLADAWSGDVRAAVERFADEVRGNARLEVVFDQSTYTNARLRDLTFNLGLGAFGIWIVVACIMGWRIGTLVASALPLSATAILIGFQVLGVPLHQMSVFGLLVAMGLLIDNAIVVSDDVWTLRRGGASPRDAVVRATRHLTVPLLASSLTTALSFAPILLLQGNVGEFVGSIATSVILAVFVSLFLSLTIVAALAGLVPMPAARPARPVVPARPGRWSRWRSWWQRVARPGRLAGLAAVPALLGFALAGTLENQFFPAADRDQFQVEVYANGTTSVTGTQALVERIDARLRADQRVRATMWVAGQSLPSVYYNQIMLRDDAPAYAQGVVVTDDALTAKELVRWCEAELAAVAPEAMVVVRPFAQGPPIAAPVLLRVTGDDLGTLVELGERVRRVMASVDGVLHTRASIPDSLPTGEVVFDEQALRDVGLSLAEASNQLRVALDGSPGGLAAGEVLEGTRRVPVVVRQRAQDRRTVQQLAGFELVAPRAVGGDGGRVPLAAVAEVRPAARVAAITRRNGERVNSLFGFVDSTTLPIEAVAEVMRRLEAEGIRVPDGYRIELGGDAEESDEAAAQLVRYVPLLGTIIAATLVLSFRSGLLALLLAVVACLSAGYGLLALWVSGFPLGFNPLIGLAGLIGITFNDSIVVLAAIRGDRDAAAGEPGAVARVVAGCRRHVWATTLTTAVGFLPLLLFSGGDFWPPLAVVIAGGVLGATPLALAFVPAAYRLLVRIRPALGRLPETEVA